MKRSWTSRRFLSVAALIGALAVVLAANSPASRATQGTLVATQVAPARAAPARRAVATDVLPPQTPTGSPRVRILQPADRTHYWYGDAIPVTLAASAQDGNGNAIADSAIVWTDSLAGALGTGATLQHVFLSGGAYSQHVITATAMTADGKRGSDTVTIEIGFTQ